MTIVTEVGYIFHDELVFKFHFDIYNQRLSSVNRSKNEKSVINIKKAK